VPLFAFLLIGICALLVLVGAAGTVVLTAVGTRLLFRGLSGRTRGAPGRVTGALGGLTMLAAAWGCLFPFTVFLVDYLYRFWAR
jgi:hypothetical protein